MRMFTKEVEDYFLGRSFPESAEFMKIVKEWHEACNSRGLSADQQIQGLHAMHDFLLKDVDLTEFPPPPFLHYIKGMKFRHSKLYCRIFQHISNSTHSHLEAITMPMLFQCSPMRVFFSDLCCLDKESPVYPKACNVRSIMGQVVALNYFKHKHKPNKNFTLMTTTKGTSPVHILESKGSRIKHKSKTPFRLLSG